SAGSRCSSKAADEPVERHRTELVGDGLDSIALFGAVPEVEHVDHTQQAVHDGAVRAAEAARLVSVVQHALPAILNLVTEDLELDGPRAGEGAAIADLDGDSPPVLDD